MKSSITIQVSHRFEVRVFEPKHNKTSKMTCANDDDSDQIGRKPG